MSFYEHLTDFAGLPVVEFLSPAIEQQKLLDAQWRARRAEQPVPDRWEPGDIYAEALAQPGTAAWRLRVVADSDETFEDHFTRFISSVDTTQVTALIIGCWGESYEIAGDMPRDLLTAHADRFPALRSLFFGEFIVEEAEISWIEQTDLAPLLAAFPGMEELVVRGGNGLRLSATQHRSLRKLTAQTGGLPRQATAGILASELPALEHLELWFGVEGYGGTTTLDDQTPLLAGELFPSLRSLGLRNSEWGDDLVRALAEAPVLERVRVLNLSDHVLTDAGGEVLATAPTFRTLERLVIRHHFLTEGMQERVRAALAGVDLELSDARKPEVYQGKTYYYPSVTE